MTDVRLNFNNCCVSIGTMLDIHDNQNVKINTQDETEKVPKNYHPGPKKKILFKDMAACGRERDRFLGYLSEHKLGNHPLTCKKNDTLNDVITCFLTRWTDLHYTTEEVSGASVFRFLTEECKLRSEVTEKSFGNEINERMYQKSYSVETMLKVSSCF